MAASAHGMAACGTQCGMSPNAKEEAECLLIQRNRLQFRPHGRFRTRHGRLRHTGRAHARAERAGTGSRRAGGRRLAQGGRRLPQAGLRRAGGHIVRTPQSTLSARRRAHCPHAAEHIAAWAHGMVAPAEHRAGTQGGRREHTGRAHRAGAGRAHRAGGLQGPKETGEAHLIGCIPRERSLQGYGVGNTTNGNQNAL